MRFGLLGEKLGHSYSPELHAFFGDYEYELFEVAPDQLGDFIRNGDFQGLNVTIPYKTTMLALCDDLTEAAAAIGSVNTVVRHPDGSLFGDNTDAAGFEGLVWKSRISIRGRKCLVLGSGGASLSVQYVLHKLGAGEIVVISRSGPDNYENLAKHADAEVIVNTTPVGMYPNTAAAPVDLRRFPRCQGVLDLIYNPARTALMQQAEALKIPNMGGLFMLAEQARCAASVFTGKAVPAIKAEEAWKTLGSRKENRILIGMPGCGQVYRGQGPGRPAGPALCGLRQGDGKCHRDVRGRLHHALWRRGLPGGGDGHADPAGQDLRAGHRHRAAGASPGRRTTPVCTRTGR